MPGAGVFEAALLRYDRSKVAIEEAMSTTLVKQSHRLERHLSVLGTLAVIAPFIGLFGTVLGIIRSFGIWRRRQTRIRRPSARASPKL